MNAWLVRVVMHCLPCLMFLCSAVQAQSQSMEEIILNYQERVEQARRLQARVQLEFYPQYKSEIVDEMKPELESIYSLPVEDPIYAAAPLYFTSNAVLIWDLILNGPRMSVAQQTLSSYIRLSHTDTRQPGRVDFIRRLQAPSSNFIDYRFSYDINQRSEIFPRWNLFAPRELLEWHFIPNLWYPSLRQIGLPESTAEVEFHRGVIEPHTLVYTPQNLDASLMQLLRQICDRPDLDESDLLNIVAIDPNTYACLSFDICIEERGQRLYLMKIHHLPSGDAVDSLPYPSTTSISVITRVCMDDESKANDEVGRGEDRLGVNETSAGGWTVLYYGKLDYAHVVQVE